MAGFTPRTPTEMGRETTSPTSHTGTMKGPGGVRIDRVYLNFDIIGATLEVQTFHHPGLDHKGVLYRIRGNPGAEKASTVKALPHRAFDLPEVVKFASDSV